ncbi:MAG TPA: hypothetical protein VGG45_04775 [Terracidiphilus sp.]
MEEVDSLEADDEVAVDGKTTRQLVAEVKRLESVRNAYESGDVLPLVKLITKSAPQRTVPIRRMGGS